MYTRCFPPEADLIILRKRIHVRLAELLALDTIHRREGSATAPDLSEVRQAILQASEAIADDSQRMTADPMEVAVFIWSFLALDPYVTPSQFSRHIPAEELNEYQIGFLNMVGRHLTRLSARATRVPDLFDSANRQPPSMESPQQITEMIKALSGLRDLAAG